MASAHLSFSPVFPQPSFPSALSWPAQRVPCRRRLPSGVFTEEPKPSPTQIFPFSLSPTESARDQKGNRGELESASIKSCREKNPYKRNQPRLVFRKDWAQTLAFAPDCCTAARQNFGLRRPRIELGGVVQHQFEPSPAYSVPWTEIAPPSKVEATAALLHACLRWPPPLQPTLGEVSSPLSSSREEPHHFPRTMGWARRLRRARSMAPLRQTCAPPPHWPEWPTTVQSEKSAQD
jgi:hypothetical protein